MRREIEEQRRRHLREVEQRRADQVDDLMKQAMQHRKDGDLEAAINVLRQVSVIDPKHQPARWMMDALEELRQYRLGRRLRDDLYDETRKALNDVEEAKIPWSDLVRYPEDWLELISRPTRRQGGLSAPDSRLLGLLDRRIPVDFNNEPFDQVIERLAAAF